MSKKSFCYGLFFWLFFLDETLSQVNTHGTPFIKNHSSQEYQFHPKNFSVTQDNRGIMYFANTYGVLEYDGVSWNTINLPDGKSAISFAQNSEGQLFIGSVGEVGYLDVNPVGVPFYTSLVQKLPAQNRNFGEVWRTFTHGDRIVFCSYQQISVFDEDSVRVFLPLKPGMVFDYFGTLNGRIFCRESGRGLLEFKNNKFELINGGAHFSNHVVYFIQPHRDGKLLIISDAGSGLYDERSYKPISNAMDSFVTKNGITCGVVLNENYGALASVNNGILVFDINANPVKHLSKKDGLASDYIFDLYVDKENNLWAATDNGISHIQISNPLTSIGEQAGLQGMGYASYVYDDKLYLGTSKGLYVKDWQPNENPLNASGSFSFVKNSEGQVMFIGEAEGVLLCGHTRGLFQLKNGNALKISPGDYTGGWTYRVIMNKPFLILGTYEGLEIYEQKNGSWQFRNKVSGFNESSRTMEIDKNDNLWVCHGNKGLFRIALNENLDQAVKVENVSVTHGFEPDYFNDIAIIEGELTFAGTNHVYHYNTLMQKLVPDDQLNKIIGDNILISKISQMQNGDIWLVNDDVIEVLAKQPDGTWVKDKTVFSKLKGQLIGSYEYYWRHNDSNYYIGTQNGFVHFDPGVIRSLKEFNTVIRKVESINHGDSTLFGGSFLNPGRQVVVSQPESQRSEFPYNQNALRFSWAALSFDDQEKNQFQYYLQRNGEAGNDNWSDWTNVTYKEHTNLWEGDYIFRVRAKNIHGLISKGSTYKFVILPPWYRTTYAYVIYSILFFMFLSGVTRLVMIKMQKERLRVEKEKAKEILLMEKQFAEEALKAEREIILLQNEKLEADVRHKNDELAHLATNLSQKSEFLTQVKKELVAFSRHHEHEANGSLAELIKTIDKGSEFDDSWDHFQANFDTVHHNFLYKIRERFPFLKSTDLLLCAYIRINKSNKEISSLLNISVSAVEKRRFRLREKLKLDDDTRLTEFLMEV